LQAFKVLCRYAFFQSSLAISVVCFGLWQKEQRAFGGIVQSILADYLAIGLLLLIFLLTLHTSLYLLPLVRLSVLSSCYVFIQFIQFARVTCVL
jgi:hypothetical protein